MLRAPGSKLIALVVFCGLLILSGPWWAQAAVAFQTPDASTQESPPFPLSNPPLFPNKSKITQKQQNAIIKGNFKKTKKDVEKLSTLTNSLKKEIQASNPNVMSIDIVNKANQIEKLAKKIKEESEM